MVTTTEPASATSLSYWVDIAIRGYESLPRAGEIGHHNYPRIIPALLNLAALEDHSRGKPWQIDVLTNNPAGMMLDRHTPEAGCWSEDDSAWQVAPSPRDDLLDLPEFAAAMDELSGDHQHVITCRETEAGVLALIKIAGMHVAVLPGSDAHPTSVFVPREQAGQFRQALEGTQLMKRFHEAPNTSRSSLIPNRTSHDWLGVTDNLGEISSVTRLTLPDDDQAFFLSTTQRIEHFQGDLSCLEPADLRRFNALRHRYLMPEAMFGPVASSDTTDESYEMSSMICMAGTMHRNLDREASVLGQAISEDSLERKVRLHMGQALREDRRRHANWQEVCGPDATELLNARVASNLSVRNSLWGVLEEVPNHLPPKATPISDIRVSRTEAPEMAERGEYAAKGDHQYQSQMSPF